MRSFGGKFCGEKRADMKGEGSYPTFTKGGFAFEKAETNRLRELFTPHYVYSLPYSEHLTAFNSTHRNTARLRRITQLGGFPLCKEPPTLSTHLVKWYLPSAAQLTCM